jgi:hypothetical protein
LNLWTESLHRGGLRPVVPREVEEVGFLHDEGASLRLRARVLLWDQRRGRRGAHEEDR